MENNNMNTVKQFRKLYGRLLLNRWSRPLSFFMSSFVLAGVLGVGLLVGANTMGVSKAECPAGSYDAGYGVCKAQPTGCPYGDSIPIDSPKCVPPLVYPALPTDELNTPTPVSEPAKGKTCQ